MQQQTDTKRARTARGSARFYFKRDLLDGKIFPYAESTLDEHIRKGLFPQPIMIGRKRAWPCEIVHAWEDALVAQAFAANGDARQANATRAREAQAEVAG